MNEIDRIDSFLQRFGDVWKRYPNMKFAQIIYNIFGGRDPSYMDDERFIKIIEEYYEG